MDLVLVLPVTGEVTMVGFANNLAAIFTAKPENNMKLYATETAEALAEKGWVDFD